MLEAGFERLSFQGDVLEGFFHQAPLLSNETRSASEDVHRQLRPSRGRHSTVCFCGHHIVMFNSKLSLWERERRVIVEQFAGAGCSH